MAWWLIKTGRHDGTDRVFVVQSASAPYCFGVIAMKRAHCEECARLIADYGLEDGPAHAFAHGSEDERFMVFLRG